MFGFLCLVSEGRPSCRLMFSPKPIHIHFPSKGNLFKGKCLGLGLVSGSHITRKYRASMSASCSTVTYSTLFCVCGSLYIEYALCVYSYIIHENNHSNLLKCLNEHFPLHYCTRHFLNKLQNLNADDNLINAPVSHHLLYLHSCLERGMKHET